MAEQAGTAVQVKPVHEIVMSMLFGVGVEEDEEAQVRVLARIYAKGAKVPRDEVGILAGAFRHAIQVYTSYFFGQETVELLRQALANIEAQKEPKGETTEKMSKANLDELQEEVEILFALLKSRDFGLRARDPHVWNGRVQSCLTNLPRLTEQPLK